MVQTNFKNSKIKYKLSSTEEFSKLFISFGFQNDSDIPLED